MLQYVQNRNASSGVRARMSPKDGPCRQAPGPPATAAACAAPGRRVPYRLSVSRACQAIVQGAPCDSHNYAKAGGLSRSSFLAGTSQEAHGFTVVSTFERFQGLVLDVLQVAEFAEPRP